MSTVLDLAIEAYGGWQRWQRVNQLSAHVSVGGATLALKGWRDALADARFTVNPKHPHTEITPLARPGQRGVYEPTRTSIVGADGTLLESRDHPRQAFAGHTLTTPWDAQHLLYFAGYAMWTYLTTPFLFTMPGFQTQELASWEENGETWRRLQVHFPVDVPSHSPVQTLYFGADGLLRRHDYSVDVIGGTSSANYPSDYKNYGGLIFPTKRRIYNFGADNLPLRERTILSIDFHTIDVP
jgi:hypothetical protein